MAPIGTIRDLHPYYNIQGVDVSKWQGLINWDEMVKHIDFAIIRAGDAKIWPDMKDTQFVQNWQTVRFKGIPHGAYWFFRTDVDPIEQANKFISFMGGWYGTLPPIIDVEKNDGNLTPTKLADAVNKFMYRVKQLTRKECGLYTSPGFAPNIGANFHYTSTKLMWVAQFNDYITEPRLPQGWSRWDFWQKEADNNGVYHTGYAMGARSHAIDRNVFHGDANLFQARFGIKIKPRGSGTAVGGVVQVAKSYIPRTNLQLRERATTMSSSRGLAYATKRFEVLETGQDERGRPWYRIGKDMWLGGWLGKVNY